MKNQRDLPTTPKPSGQSSLPIRLSMNQPVMTEMGVLVFDNYVIESIAPNPNDPNDVGGSAVYLGIRLGEKPAFGMTIGEIKEPISVWDNDLRLSVHSIEDGRVPAITITLSRPTKSATSAPENTFRLSGRDPKQLHGSLHIRLKNWTPPTSANAIALNVDYILHHPGQGSMPSSSSPVASEELNLSANNRQWIWRDFLFQATSWDDEGVNLEQTRLLMESFSAIAQNGDPILFAQQEAWSNFLASMITGRLSDLEAMTTKDAYKFLLQHASSYDLPTHAFVKWGLAWGKMPVEWQSAISDEVTLQIGQPEKPSRFVLAKVGDSWKVSQYHPGH